jgi:group I intron endonuclease
MYTIYKIIFPNTETYIGLTKNLHKRKIAHKTRSKNNERQRDLPLYYAIRKYGFDNLIWEILEECYTLEQACELETKFISDYRPKYNVAAGGMVHKYTDEMRDKMRKARSGKARSEETKRRQSESLKKYYDEKGRKEKIDKPKRRNRRASSPEVIQKQRDNWERRKRENITKLSLLYNEGMTLKDLSEISGISVSTITSYNREWDTTGN